MTDKIRILIKESRQRQSSTIFLDGPELNRISLPIKIEPVVRTKLIKRNVEHD